MITTKAIFFLIGPLAFLCFAAHGQYIPAVTGPPSSQGFSLPDTSGSLRYALSASQIFRTGYYNDGDLWETSFSGDLAYICSSDVRPFSAVYSGGYSLTFGGGQPSYVFQNLALSQVFNIGTWKYIVSDSVRYLPDSPVGGLSGISGVGDVGVPAPPIDTNGGDILSGYGQRISNDTQGSVSRNFTGSTYFHASGSYSVQRFIDTDGGLATNQWSAAPGITHRIDALTDASLNYSYSNFNYPGNNFTFISQSLNLQYSRQVNRKLSVDASAGPERTSTTTTPSDNSKINFDANAGAAYIGQNIKSEVRYIRGASGGSGVVQGSFSDSVHVSASRQIGRLWSASAIGSYNRNRSLGLVSSTPFAYQTYLANLQASTSLSEFFSAFVTYGIQKQTSNTAIGAINSFNGVIQTVSVGITYSPTAKHLGHQ